MAKRSNGRADDRDRRFVQAIHLMCGRYLGVYQPKDRGMQLLQHLVDGVTVEEIAELEGVTSRSIERRLETMQRKHGASTRMHLVAIGVRRGEIRLF